MAWQRAPHATSEEGAGGAAAWPGFEPTHRAKLAARTASGPDGSRNIGGTARNNPGDAASKNTCGTKKPGGGTPPTGLYARLTFP